MNLIIDIGNSRTKFACFKNNEIIHVNYYLTIDQNAVREIKSRFSSFRNIIVSSVKKEDDFQYNLISKHFENVILLNQNTKLPIEICYKSTNTLGMDRIAAVVGASHMFPKQNVLIIDAGTAITFDFLNSKNQYMGGNISPGLNMRFQALNKFTGNLPLLSPLDEFQLIGNSTSQAIISGVQNGMIFEIDTYIHELKMKYSDLKVIFTGGDSFFFERKLKNPIFAESNLVLIGLNKIIDYQ
ncbi:MAG: type III pantothenate kinase [Bacteroidetes bacterium]|jgi:type III pantothenate kinase|nr:type III pantothenate kinase [Bacteroidota bacterium]MBT6686489.1 type III pantothenate kinase [Bacteroidota bacterium]MBT7143337.1 type III pantothenate kinase [Bacteroidota bacterium]MBT7491553.1 type III pantothenate kinase [Bacteroidota bacterium]